ncbi:MAG: sigma-E processing peptidase SpoIIGA [Oscillospiraceae bacterium]|nr:sigma-E processing peptidase SpoIIGA [Oscillospiraceae bacterium]
MQAIYGDIFFIINFSMDFLALYLAGKILRRRMRLSLLCLAAGFGGVYSVLALFFAGSSAVATIINIAVFVLMCFIAFGFTSAKAFGLVCLLFVCVSFFLGGAMTAFYNLLNQIFAPGQLSESSANPIQLWHLAVLAAAAAATALVWGRVTYSKAKKPEVSITLTLFGSSTEVIGMVDSGNLLVEPISGRSVIMVKSGVAALLLPPEARDLSLGGITSVPEKLAGRIRMIPTQSVGGHRMIVGILPDKLVVDGIEKEGCIGIDQDKEGDYGGFMALVPALLVE